MKTPTRNAAILRIDSKLLTGILDFKGGIIHRIYTKDEWIAPQPNFYVVIEHPDLPEVPQAEMLREITPIMQCHYGEDNSLIGTKRTYPSKKTKLLGKEGKGGLFCV